jgi:hypothetical protein
MSVDSVLGLLLKEQGALQERMGHDFEAMSTEERMRYFRDQALALIKEVTEVMDTVPWKPWATYPADAEINDGEYVEELADVLIFFLNLLLVGDVHPDRLVEAVDRKITKNQVRLDSGYDGHWATTEG